MPYLILDARYEKVRHGGSVVSCAVLVAIGIDAQGHRSILGTSVSLSEAEPHWRDFLASLQGRGLHGVRMIASDAHAGLKEALRARFPAVPWQRCQFHLAQNAMAYVPKVAMRKEVGAGLRAVFDAPDRAEAERQLDLAVKKYRTTAPKLAEWMEANVPEGLTAFALPSSHRRRLRTTNMLERINREIKRRTRVATLFPNEASALRLVSAVLDGDQRGVGDEPQVRDDGAGMTCRRPGIDRRVNAAGKNNCRRSPGRRRPKSPAGSTP